MLGLQFGFYFCFLCVLALFSKLIIMLIKHWNIYIILRCWNYAYFSSEKLIKYMFIMNSNDEFSYLIIDNFYLPKHWLYCKYLHPYRKFWLMNLVYFPQYVIISGFFEIYSLHKIKNNRIKAHRYVWCLRRWDVSGLLGCRHLCSSDVWKLVVWFPHQKNADQNFL